VVCLLAVTAEAWAASTWVVTLRSGSSGLAKADVTPAAPGTVAAACTSSTLKTIKVTWAAVTHAVSYTVYQSTTSATTGFTAVASGLATTNWTSGSLAAGHYWYEVTATVGANWQSAKSTASGSTTIASSAPNCAQP
jgi:hypothetical protein